MIKHHRRNPLVQTCWLGTADTLRFAFGALTMRLLLSEQTYAGAGLLRTLGIGPLLLTGVMKTLAKGADHIVTFSVLFAVTQSIGGLAGPAIYGTFEQVRQHEYSAQIAANLDPGDPVVAQRLAQQG